MNNERVRQRVARLLLWLFGGRQTRDQYTQSARYQADGQLWGQQDPDVSQQQARQARETFERQRRQGGRGYGR